MVSNYLLHYNVVDYIRSSSLHTGKEIPEAWAVVLEPLAMHQRHFQKPVRIFLKGTATQWSLPMSSTVGSDSWMLRSPEECPSTQRALFQQLVDRLTAEEFHLVGLVHARARAFLPKITL